ncbi:glycoside hydrolase family 65 protein [Gryllotalpicola protaetiae]|uniref:Glycoside hydrolase family 65 protein n=1 Tax=Gryllotalpicola protaetiae TaxID=2419771 RepID=A0A387BI77_9MICO|nr:glycosyl hydrolase family 65 protein [Gryllotalpicola protaetiae]AYG03523.1 glycoside hydrolase family 65 protein [Gryllotalpicola protaetiae]
MRRPIADPLDRDRFPIDEWALVESELSVPDLGRTETLFSVGNGYIGLRGNFEEAREGVMQGTFVNGFHETWPIRHAEDAFGFAHVGQTIVNAPDAKVIRVYVDDVPFKISEAELLSYERRLDFVSGVLTRDLEWRTPSGRRVQITSRRFASFTDRHLAVVDYEVTVLDADASVVLSSQVINRQDRKDEYGIGGETLGDDGFDPRKAESFTDRVLQPRLKRNSGGRSLLGYRCTNSRMTIAVAADHVVETDNEITQSYILEDDLAKQEYRVQAKAGVPIRLTKLLSYHTSYAVPVRELADRCDRTLDRVRERGVAQLFDDQRLWLDDFWSRADVEVFGRASEQQAVRWNLFQLAQATARADGLGIPAKGVTGSGYGGHYFWDMEIYVLPFLTYTNPTAARNALRFRHSILDDARARAGELSQRGALFPWRTINGQESSAYYAAGTAQYHIDADISFALVQYVNASGDEAFLDSEGIDILIETARMWADLGFWRYNGGEIFHIHGVTGPDEYTTVVNDNLYTNVMARCNLRAAVRSVKAMKERDPSAYRSAVNRLGLTDDEVAEWARAAEAMHVPYDDSLGINPQDAQFLEKELWDLPNTPLDKLPLLLHYHPLVIYRFQVLKQADVVLALVLQGDEFSPEQKLADFEYYDPLTTGDSTLSAVAQSIIAAEVGYSQLAVDYFLDAAFVDLADLHNNAVDGVHVASTGGLWAALVWGFGGVRDYLGVVSMDPRLPSGWEGLRYRLTVKGSRLRVELRRESVQLRVEEGDGVEVTVRGDKVFVRPGEPRLIPLDGQGPIRHGTPSTSALKGELRPDGSVMTASIPTLAADDPTPTTGTSPIPVIQLPPGN